MQIAAALHLFLVYSILQHPKPSIVFRQKSKPTHGAWNFNAGSCRSMHPPDLTRAIGGVCISDLAREIESCKTTTRPMSSLCGSAGAYKLLAGSVCSLLTLRLSTCLKIVTMQVGFKAVLLGSGLLLASHTLAQSSSFVCTGVNAQANYNASTTYLGCWTDSTSRTLSGPQLNFANNDPQVCANACGYRGYNISAVEYTTYGHHKIRLEWSFC